MGGERLPVVLVGSAASPVPPALDAVAAVDDTFVSLTESVEDGTRLDPNAVFFVDEHDCDGSTSLKVKVRVEH